MATSTEHLNLALLATGESVGTWGIPLNNNFSKIDVLAGEVINASGPEQDLNDRFNSIEQEIEDARGVMPLLGERLNVLLQADGNIRIEAVPKATQSQIGVTRLSINPVIADTPIALGENDPRLLLQSEHDELVNGGNTALHKHLLINGASDVQATYSEIDQALYGIGTGVTSANLTSLTNGSIIPDALHKHQGAGLANEGLVRLSVTPALISDPIAVGDNDPRMLTQGQHDGLVLGNSTSIHKHLLIDGASDLTVTATILNQLAGSSGKVTATNLNLLTEGSPTGTGASDASQLHHHDNAYYRKAEVDAHLNNLSTEIDGDIETHNAADISHTGANFSLGDVIMTSLAMNEDGELLSLHKGNGDGDNTPKLVVRDGSGVSKAYIDSEGDITCNNITVNGDQTLIGDSLVETSFTINGTLDVSGNTTLGDGPDDLVINCLTSAFNGDITLTGGITGAAAYNGIVIEDLNTAQIATQTEVTNARKGEADLVTQITAMENATTAVLDEVIAARNTEASLDAKVDAMDATTLLVTNEVNTARGGETSLDTRLDNIEASETAHEVRSDNPHLVTFTQSIAADGSDVTKNELETLTDGANADGLHFHEEYRSEIENSKASPVLPGSPFVSMSARLDAGDQVSENIATEVINARTDVSSFTHESLDARLDTKENELDIWKQRTDNPHLVTFTQAVSADGITDVLASEIETLTNTSNADALHIHNKYDTTTLEVETARDGQGSLNARLNTMESGIGNHEGLTNNPHGVTITQAVTADAVSTLTISELEGVTNGSNADGLHVHDVYTATSNEVVTARDSAAFGSVYGTLDARLEVGETELVNARTSDIYGSYGTLDARLEVADAEINTARNGLGSLNIRLTAMQDEITLNTAKATPVTQTIAVATTTWSILHNLNTKDIIVTIYDASDVEIFKEAANITSITTTNLNTVDIVFPTAQDGRVIVTGV